MRTYIGQGVPEDPAWFESEASFQSAVESLRKRGADGTVIEQALTDARRQLRREAPSVACRGEQAMAGLELLRHGRRPGTFRRKQ